MTTFFWVLPRVISRELFFVWSRRRVVATLYACSYRQLTLQLVAMDRAAEPLLSFGPPAEGAPPVPMEQSLAKRPCQPAEAEQASATPVARRMALTNWDGP